MDGICDELAYALAVVRNCRRRFFPLLWLDLSKADMLDSARSLAWLVLNEDHPADKRALWNAVQRRLYRECTLWDIRRRRSQGMRYQPMAVNDEPSANLAAPVAEEGAYRPSFVQELAKVLDAVELAILGGMALDLESAEIAQILGISESELAKARRQLRAKLQSLKGATK